jgi:hypothetical protein
MPPSFVFKAISTGTAPIISIMANRVKVTVTKALTSRFIGWFVSANVIAYGHQV